MALTQDLNKSFFQQVAEGTISGYTIKHVHGYASTVTALDTHIWNYSGTVSAYLWPTSAVSLEAVSLSADDTSGGTGAQIITVEGLDGSFNEISEDITMAGLSTTSATSSSYIRVNDAYVKEAGTYAGGGGTGANAANITIQDSGGGSVRGVMVGSVFWGDGNIANAHYTIPAGKTGLMYDLNYKADTQNGAHINLWTREGADIVASPFTTKRKILRINDCTDNAILSNNLSFGPFPEKTDIWFTATRSGPTDSTVDVSFNLLLIDN